MYGGVTAPTGWLLCDGSTVGRVAYPGLFNAVSTLYGSGDGSTTFTLPDMRGRMPVGKGTHSDVSTLGNNDGVTVANRRSKHQHTAHTHTQNAHTHASTNTGFTSSNTAGFEAPSMGTHTNESGWTTGSATATNQTADGGSGNTNDPTDAPAYLVINYIIKT